MVATVAIRHEVFKVDSPMRACQMEVDLPRLEQFHEMRTRHVQDVGGFLGGQLVADGDDHNGVTLGHVVSHAREDVEYGGRDFRLLTIGRLQVGTCFWGGTSAP